MFLAAMLGKKGPKLYNHFKSESLLLGTDLSFASIVQSIGTTHSDSMTVNTSLPYASIIPALQNEEEESMTFSTSLAAASIE